MFAGRLYRAGALVDDELDPSRLSELLDDPDACVWIDVADPDEDALQALGREFGVHALSLEDMRHRDQRPKVEGFGSYFFVVVRPLRLDGVAELLECEVHCLVGPNFLVTIRYAPEFDLSNVLRRWDRNPELTKEGAGFFLYVVLDEVVDDYLEILERFEDAADDVEDEVFSEGEMPPDPVAVQEKVFRLKRAVVRFRRSVMPLRRVLDFFQEEPSIVTAALSPYFRDVADHVIRTTELSDNIRDLLTSLLEVRVSQVANQLNEVMKKLTSWAAIILIPTLIAGVYGMNFRQMPELGWRFGYAYALVLMAASSLILYRMFKKREWL
jgi:magnesium transporter